MQFIKENEGENNIQPTNKEILLPKNKGLSKTVHFRDPTAFKWQPS